MLPVPEDMEMPAASFHSPSGSDRRQSVLSVGNGNGNARRSFATYGNNNYNGNNPRESIGASMGRTTPGSVDVNAS